MALAQADALRASGVERAARGREVIETWERSDPGIRVIKPEAGILAWAFLPEGVAVTPGRFFGDDTGFRLAFGQVDPDVLATSLAAMTSVARSLLPTGGSRA